jgi:hypothetical protein
MARLNALLRRAALFLCMMPRLAALSRADETLTYSDFATSSLPAAIAARSFRCPDFKPLRTLELRARRPTSCRARLAADLILAMRKG